MSAISQATSQSPQPSWIDHLNVGSATISFVSSVGSTIVGLSSANPFFVISGVSNLAQQFFFRPTSLQSEEVKNLRESSHTFERLVQTQQTQIAEKNRAIQEQKTEIKRLQEINAELSEKNQQLAKIQETFETLNEKHIKILEDQQKKIEENKGFLAKIRGIMQGYEDEKTRLLKEIQEARTLRTKLQTEIQTLLDKQNVLLEKQERVNQALKKRIQSLEKTNHTHPFSKV